MWEGEGEAVPGPGWSGAGHTPHTPSLCPLIPFITPPPCPFPTALIPSVHPSPGPQALQSRGYQKLVLQVGRGSLPQPQPSSSSAVAVEVFRFKDSLAAELQSADLVISHAGTAPAASCGCREGRLAGSGVGWLRMLRSAARVGLFKRLPCSSSK